MDNAAVYQYLKRRISQGRWNYGINRVRLEMVGEGPEEEFVEHTALFNVQIILDLTVAPVGKILRMIIDLLRVNGCLVRFR